MNNDFTNILLNTIDNIDFNTTYNKNTNIYTVNVFISQKFYTHKSTEQISKITKDIEKIIKIIIIEQNYQNDIIINVTSG
jgi:hypothetical protein